MRALLRPTLFASLLGVAFLVTQELVYEPFVVPRLAQWQQIPWQWWVVVFLPELAVCAAIALLSRNIYEVLTFAVLGSMILASLQWLAGLLNQPGPHPNPVEGGLLQFVVHDLTLTVLLLTVVGSMYALRRGFDRVRAS